MSHRLLRRVPLAAVFCVAMTAAAGAQVVNHPANFTGQADMTINGNAVVTGAGNLQLTSATNNQTGSAFTTAPTSVAKFATRFDFHELGTAGGMADGLGFCIQRVGPTTIGGGGGSMGYAGMLTSIFIKFDCYSNVSTTQIYQNGAAPADAGSLDMRAAGVDVHSQHNFRVVITYDGTNAVMSVTDLTTNAVFNTTFAVNIPTVIGGATAHVGFTGATGGANANQEILNWTYLLPPTALGATNGINQVTLNWTAPAGGATTYNVLRGTATGGPYTPIATGIAATNYTDSTAANPNTYYYVVQAVANGLASPNSNEAIGNPLPPAVTALPNSGLQTSEAGASTTFDIKFNQATPAGGSLVTVSSNNLNEGVVSTTFTGGTVTTTANGFTVQLVAGVSPTIPVTITGVDDVVVDGNILFTVSVSATNMGVTIPDVSCTNNDDDVQGITFSKTSGIATSESGGSDTITVTLNRQPFGTVTMDLSSSNVNEGTVSPTTLTFTPADWNLGSQHLITVTGVDDPFLDFTQYYSIVTAPLQFTDANDQAAFAAAGVLDPVDLACFNLDDEVPPTLPTVWGNAGCGLTGLEVVLVLGLGAAWRRRRRIL